MGLVQLDEPRPLNDAERSVLRALLAPDYPGVEELRLQIPDAVVVGRCDCGCPTVDIKVNGGVPRSSVHTKNRLAPYEARVAPLNHEPVGDIILFVDDGYLSSLEYVPYADPSPTEWPSLDRVQVLQVQG